MNNVTTDRRTSGLLISGTVLIISAAVFAGWLFNAGYYNEDARFATLRIFGHSALCSPAPRDVVNWFAAFYVAASALYLWTAHRMAAPRTRWRTFSLSVAVALPLVAVFAALSSRKLMENGWIDYSSMFKQKLPVGVSVQMMSYKFEQSPHGLGVFNMLDSRSVSEIVASRMTIGLFTVLGGALWAFCLAVLVTSLVKGRNVKV